VNNVVVEASLQYVVICSVTMSVFAWVTGMLASRVQHVFATGVDLRSTQTYPLGFAKRVVALAAAHSVADIIKSDTARQHIGSKYPAFESFAPFDQHWSDAGLQRLWAFVDRRLAKCGAA